MDEEFENDVVMCGDQDTELDWYKDGRVMSGMELAVDYIDGTIY